MGQVMEGAELVGHGVVHAEEGVREGHAGEAGGVVHLLAGVRIRGALLIGGRQVLEDELRGAHGEAIGVVGAHDRDEGLDGVRHDVDAGGAGEAHFGAVMALSTSTMAMFGMSW